MAWSRALRLSSGEEEKVMASRGVAVPVCVCLWLHQANLRAKEGDLPL